MVATPQSAQDAANAIRNDLKTTFGTKVSDSVRILYGGSVTSKNAAELISQPDVDGFLIGGAALDVEELAKIARLALKSTNHGTNTTVFPCVRYAGQQSNQSGGTL